MDNILKCCGTCTEFGTEDKNGYARCKKLKKAKHCSNGLDCNFYENATESTIINTNHIDRLEVLDKTNANKPKYIVDFF